MKNHILLQKAFIYKKRKKLQPPDNFVYDEVLGAWKNILDNSLLINAKNFRALATKKMDIETGEDHKGE